MSWVRFHGELRQGEKRGLSRATRFIYMELSHEGRARQGIVVLPQRMGDVDAVHEVLAGNRKEVVEAVRDLSEGPDPMIAFEERDGKRVLVVVNWRKWNPRDGTGAERQARMRNGRSNGVRNGPSDDDSNDDVTAHVTPEVTAVTDTSAGARATLLSSLSSNSSFPESSSSKTDAREREVASRPSLAPTPRLIDPKLTIDDDSREAAKALGIVEVDVQWRRFVDKSIAKGELSTDFRALFRSRLAFIRNDERRERERDKAGALFVRQNGPVDVADPYNDPKAVRERERAREAQHKALVSQAVPAPTSLAALLSASPGGDGVEEPPKKAARNGAKPAGARPEIRQPMTEAEIAAKAAPDVKRLAALERTVASDCSSEHGEGVDR